MFTLGEIIDLAVRIEKNGESTYRKAQQKVSSPVLSSMLQWLADDEAEHEKWFTKLKRNVDEKIEDPKFEEMGREILGGVLGEHTFSMDEADFSSLNDIKDLFELSLEFEKDTLVFYEMLKEFVEDEKVLSGIDKIIEEEKRHIAYIQGFLRNGEIPSLKHPREAWNEETISDFYQVLFAFTL